MSGKNSFFALKSISSEYGLDLKSEKATILVNFEKESYVCHHSLSSKYISTLIKPFDLLALA